MVNMVLGNNMKLLRKNKKKSQEEVAADLGLTRSSYSGYENGIAEPGLDTLVALGTYYAVPLDQLLTRDFTTLSELEWQSIETGVFADVNGKRLRVLTSMVNEHDDELIELIPQQARAGYTVGYFAPDYLQILTTFILQVIKVGINDRSEENTAEIQP